MERAMRIHAEQATPVVKNVYYTPSASSEEKELAVYEEVVRISNTLACTVYLPYVSEAKGKTYYISVDSATAAVTLADRDDSVNWEGDYTLDAAEDRIVLKSDGREWIEVENQIA